MNVISGQAGPGESEEPSYTFWKQGIPAVTGRRLWVRVPSSLLVSHLAQLGRARIILVSAVTSSKDCWR